MDAEERGKKESQEANGHRPGMPIRETQRNPRIPRSTRHTFETPLKQFQLKRSTAEDADGRGRARTSAEKRKSREANGHRPSIPIRDTQRDPRIPRSKRHPFETPLKQFQLAIRLVWTWKVAGKKA
jgi:hypothetical protein